MALFSVCSVYEGCRLVFLFYLFIYFLRGVACNVYGALGWDPCGVYSVSRFLLGIGVGRLWRFCSICSVYEACRLVCLLYLFIYLLYGVAWCGVACSVYGTLGWGPCGVHSVWSVYEAFWAGHLFVPFRVFVMFMGHWGGTLVAFTVLVGFYWALGLDVCGAFAAFVAFMRHAGWSVYFIYLFIYCMAWRGVALRVAFMGHWGGALVAFTAFGAFMRRFGLVAFLWHLESL